MLKPSVKNEMRARRLWSKLFMPLAAAGVVAERLGRLLFLTPAHNSCRHNFERFRFLVSEAVAGTADVTTSITIDERALGEQPAGGRISLKVAYPSRF